MSVSMYANMKATKHRPSTLVAATSQSSQRPWLPDRIHVTAASSRRRGRKVIRSSENGCNLTEPLGLDPDPGMFTWYVRPYAENMLFLDYDDAAQVKNDTACRSHAEGMRSGVNDNSASGNK